MTGPTAPTAAGAQAFLFCDLRGYAAYVDRHGDHAAAELLATYRGLVRGVIATHAGAEIRTEGDAFYVVFPAASSAVEAGLGIIAAAADGSMADRPLRVGVGIHAGETVASGEGPIGGAVNIAARVCARAQAGEVLITDTVRALTRTLLPYSYVSLGRQSLKGIGPVALYRVEATSSGRLAHLRRRLVARRRRVATAALVTVVALVATSAAWMANQLPGCLALAPETHDVVARIDPARGCVVATYAVGRRPGQIVAAADRIWVASDLDGTVAVLGPDGERVATIGGGQSIGAMAPAGDRMWVIDRATGWLEQISLDTAEVLAFHWPAPGRGWEATEAERAEVRAVLSDEAYASWYQWRAGDYRGLAADVGYVWLVNAATGRVIPFGPDGPGPPGQIDDPPDALELYCGAPVDYAPFAGCPGSLPGPDPRPLTDPLAVVGGAVFAGHETSPALSVLDKASGMRRTLTPPKAAGHTTGLAVDGDVLWVAYSGGTLARVRSGEDMKGEVVAASLTAVAAAHETVWAASDDRRALLLVDPETLGVVASVGVGGRPTGVAIAANGAVWVTIAGE